MRETTAQELEQPIQQLELHLAIRRLLTHLGGQKDLRYTPGRYQVLALHIKQHPALLNALLFGNDTQMQRAWLVTLQDSSLDIRFLHGLAVAYREIMLANLRQPTDNLNDSIMICSALWAILLSTPDFWHYFSPARVISEDGGREPLMVQQQNELITTTLEDLFSLHCREGKKALATGNSERARLHLQCLTLCHKGEKELTALLLLHNISYKFPVDSQLVALMTKLAGQQIDAWCDSLLEDAERILTDPRALAQLPSGIQENYKEAIAYLAPFILLDIPMERILLTTLVWSNLWLHDAHAPLRDTTFPAVRAVVSPIVRMAQPAADQLAALAKKDKGNIFKPEVHELGTHFHYRAIAVPDEEEGLEICAEALAWEPENEWHQGLQKALSSEFSRIGKYRKPVNQPPVSRLSPEEIERLLQKGREAFAAQHFDMAEQHMKTALEAIRDKEQRVAVCIELSHIYSAHGEYLLKDINLATWQRRTGPRRPFTSEMEQAQRCFETAFKYYSANVVATNYMNKLTKLR
ncbi:MAG TPA: hypothetical protein VKR06_12880 [Ktedonosporobacter sp.]|nr:hypothetical protein [Ktedonosporobacter sp.]